MKQKAILIGATGRVGQALVRELCSLYETVIVITRTPPKFLSNNMQYYQVADFDNLKEVMSAVALDDKTDAFCTLWASSDKAELQDEYIKIHLTYPYEFAKICQQKGVKRFFLLSKAKANANSSDVLLHLKGELEERLADLGFDSLVCFGVDRLTLPKDNTLKNMTKKAIRFVGQVLPQDEPLSPTQIATSMALVAYRTLYVPDFIHQLSPEPNLFKNLGKKGWQNKSDCQVWTISHKQLLNLSKLIK